MSAIETGVRRVGAEELLLATERLSVPEYFTDPSRLDGEGSFSGRQMVVAREQLMEYEATAGRWIERLPGHGIAGWSKAAADAASARSHEAV